MNVRYLQRLGVVAVLGLTTLAAACTSAAPAELLPAPATQSTTQPTIRPATKPRPPSRRPTPPRARRPPRSVAARSSIASTPRTPGRPGNRCASPSVACCW